MTANLIFGFGFSAKANDMRRLVLRHCRSSASMGSPKRKRQFISLQMTPAYDWPQNVPCLHFWLYNMLIGGVGYWNIPGAAFLFLIISHSRADCRPENVS